MKHKRSPVPRTPTWTCPKCKRVHTPADLLRLDSERIQCKRCGEPFSGIADGVSSAPLSTS